jgi:hypothetical protein
MAVRCPRVLRIDPRGHDSMADSMTLTVAWRKIMPEHAPPLTKGILC